MTQIVLASASSNIVNIPTTIGQFQPNAPGGSVSNIVLYLNNTDGHYHVKGIFKNTLPETQTTTPVMGVDFYDKPRTM
jgi:hypothetical protein